MSSSSSSHDTEDFDVGDRVRVVHPKGPLNLVGMIGTVVGRDAYVVKVRMDKITEAMKDYEDGRTGKLNFPPEALENC